jgi:hypothetical protein
MSVLFVMSAEVRREGRWELSPQTLRCSGSNHNAMAVFTGYDDPPPLMNHSAAFQPLRGVPPDASPQVRRGRIIGNRRLHRNGDRQINTLHSFMLVRHGHVIAAAW